jgi:hypothetical protein
MTQPKKYWDKNVLERHPHTAEPRPADVPRLILGSTMEFFVTVLFSNPPSSGFARPAGPLKRNRINHCYFRYRDIMTIGAETLRVGSQIRGVVSDNPGKNNYRLAQIEIFKEENSQEEGNGLQAEN